MKKDIEYNQLMVSIFPILVDMYGVDLAIIILYKINKTRGVKI